MPHSLNKRNYLVAVLPRNPLPGNNPRRLFLRCDPRHKNSNEKPNPKRLRIKYRQGNRQTLRQDFSRADAGGAGRQSRPVHLGKDATQAVEAMVVLEEIATTALRTIVLKHKQTKISKYLLDKHFFRKHGEKAYYGQGGN